MIVCSVQQNNDTFAVQNLVSYCSWCHPSGKKHSPQPTGVQGIKFIWSVYWMMPHTQENNKNWLVKTSEFLLPDHFIEEIISPGEEVGNLATLLVPLRRVEYLQFASLSQVVTDGRYLEHYPLQGSVVSYNLDRVLRGGRTKHSTMQT